jgi:hypothetical protein
MAVVPVKIFEDADAVYIAPEYYYELAGERTETTADGGTRAFYNECNQVVNSLDSLRDPENRYANVQRWKLVVAEIRNEDDLDSFIKSRYGSSCSLGEQVASNQDGVYDVGILGDGKGLEETQCPLNFGTVVKYYPEGNKVISWHTGQASSFPADVNHSIIYDLEMVDSFNFLAAAAATPPVAPAETVVALASYSNAEYGFSFEYPTSWSLAEVNDEEFVGPGSRSVQLSQGSVKLVVGFRRHGESAGLVGRGVPGGEFVERGTVRMLGQDVPRQVLVFEGKDKGVYYNRWSVIAAGGLEFSLCLLDFDPDYGQVELPQNLQDEADAILSTLAVDAPLAGAVEPTPTAAVSPPATELTSYTNDDFGFTFQYQADWALEVVPRRPLDAGEGMPQWLADVIVLRKDKLAISIQHTRTSESIAWDGRFSGGGLPQEAQVYQMNLLGQEAQKWVWTVNGGIKAIMIQGVIQEADLVVQIELYDASVQWIGDPAAETIPEAAIGVLDQILNSLVLTQ